MRMDKVNDQLMGHSKFFIGKQIGNIGFLSSQMIGK
jgi:hypothetical protein